MGLRSVTEPECPCSSQRSAFGQDAWRCLVAIAASERSKPGRVRSDGEAVQWEAVDLVLGYLEQLGVEYVFGVPGGAIEPLYNALARSERRGGPRPVVARHECGAAFMADGYARETGRLGVCCATTGPGATNMVTGIASALQDNVPLLILTAQTPLRTLGRGAVQESSCTEINTVEMLRHCTKYSTLVSHLDQLERKLAAAVMMASQSPKGPVHLSIPLDLMRAPVPSMTPRFDVRACVQEPRTVSDEGVQQLLGRLVASHHPVFVIGDGCGRGATEIVRAAERLSAPFVATPQGKGLVDARHPLFRGVFGLAGHETAYATLADGSVDLVVAAGTRFDEIASRCWDEKHLLTERLVHVDGNARNFLFSPMAQLHVYGDIHLVFQHLVQQLDSALGAGVRCQELVVGAERVSVASRDAMARPRSRYTSGTTSVEAVDPNLVLLKDPQECLDASVPIKPQRLMHELSKRFPPGTRFLADIGNSFLWAIHYLHPRPGPGPSQIPPAGLVRFSMGFSSMGWAVGGAIGTAFGCPRTPVVSIVGDGSMLMVGQELTVAVAHEVPVIFVVLNDAALGTVKHGQRMAGAERVGFELPPVNFSQLARAQGAAAYRIGRPEDFDVLDIAAICQHRGPTLLEVLIDGEEAPPLNVRMETLRTER